MAPTEPNPASFTATKDERDSLMKRQFEADEQIRRAAAGPIPLSPDRAAILEEESESALVRYYDYLPRIPLSRCPICSEILHRAMDPWGPDGLWWQEAYARTAVELPVCAHFRVLTGALNLQGVAPHGGHEEAYPGPEVPYVVPRLLGLPTMVAVISSLPIGEGYRAYPIAYFSEAEPRAGLLTQTWCRRSYNFRSAKGRAVFTYDTSPWDFDLLPWIERGSVAWIAPGDRALGIVRTPARSCPYLHVTGRRQPLAIVGDKVRTLTLPDGRKIDPFSE